MHNQLDESTRVWGMSCHLAALAGFAIPFGSILGPLIIWLTQKDKHPFINEQGKESLNFQISMIIYGILLMFVILIASMILLYLLAYSSRNAYPDKSFFYSYPLLISLYIIPIFSIIFVLAMITIAAVKAYNGQFYRYPFNLRFLK